MYGYRRRMPEGRHEVALGFVGLGIVKEVSVNNK